VPNNGSTASMPTSTNGATSSHSRRASRRIATPPTAPPAKLPKDSSTLDLRPHHTPQRHIDQWEFQPPFAAIFDTTRFEYGTKVGHLPQSNRAAFIEAPTMALM
jgi:hypothetical protein